MGWYNPDISWAELERRLSGYLPQPQSAQSAEHEQPANGAVSDVELPYAELHCHSSYSFLDGSNDPADLVAEAARLQLHALALTDHDGFAGAPLFAEAAHEHQLRTVYGAELTLGLTDSQNGIADPRGSHLLVLARGVEGYHRLAAAITEANLRGQQKGVPAYDLEELSAWGRGHWVILTGCRKGTVRRSLAHDGRSAAGKRLDELTDMFGSDHVLVELTDHGSPLDSDINDALADLARTRGLAAVATNNVHYARPGDAPLASALAAVRARRSLDELNGWLPAHGRAHLRSGTEMSRIFRRYSDAITRTVPVADDLAFDLGGATPDLPDTAVPSGHTQQSWLRELTDRGVSEKYRDDRSARDRVDRELAVIEGKGFCGYFLIMHEIIAEARRRNILCQGRGSSASSAVCYVLGITAIDPVFYNLPFERFLSEHRDDEPDIDVDFDSSRREEIIQWVYERFGLYNAAQVANTITYRPRSAVRDAAKVLGYSAGQQDAWSKGLEHRRRIDPEAAANAEIPDSVVQLAEQFTRLPRHLGIHSGGMVLTKRPIGQVCPIERARMEGRTVLQWDKESCAWMGLVKFDLLGLGMLGAISAAFDLIAEHIGETWELSTIPREEPAVYDMLCRADSIGVFQVESRAQIGTLPRLQPRSFYDLAIEIALIRPGPIQGGAVHPYIRRATGREAVDYPHPGLADVLERTKGVPLFQEQLMQMAMKIGNLTGGEADLLRRAMGSKRGIERIDTLRRRIYAGMAEWGITGQDADALYIKIESFANFGFAESHALSFALLVYASSWLKLHYPGAFLAALLRNQPMGFYSPQSLVADARRHGVRVLRPDITTSPARTGLSVHGEPVPAGQNSCLRPDQPPVGPFDPHHNADPALAHRRDGAFYVQLGLDYVAGVSTGAAERLVAERTRAPFTDIADVARRAGLTDGQLEAMATAGAFDSSGLSRRQALWLAGNRADPAQIPGTDFISASENTAPMLPAMSSIEETSADLWATGISPDLHPMEYLRNDLRTGGILSTADAHWHEASRRIYVAGLVTHRQRPSTAAGVTFLNVEDETGMLNIVCSVGLWRRYRRFGSNAAGLIIRGILERNDGVTNLVADALKPIEATFPQAHQLVSARHSARNFC